MSQIIGLNSTQLVKFYDVTYAYTDDSQAYCKPFWFLRQSIQRVQKNI